MAKFTVVGNHSVAGVDPGGVVELSPEEADWLVDAGHLSPYATPKTTAPASAEVDDTEQSEPDSEQGGE